MKLGKRKAAAAILVTMAVILALVAWQVWDATAGLVVLVMAGLGGTAVLAWMLARQERTLRKSLRDAERRLERALTTERERLREGQESIRNLLEALREQTRHPGEYTEQLLQTFNAATTRSRMEQEAMFQTHLDELRETAESFRRDIRRELDRNITSRRKDLLTNYRQVEALIALYHELSPSAALPPAAGWAASPDLLLYLYRVVRERKPDLILECGSGVSTLIMAYALSENGSGRIVSLEHSEQYFKTTLEWLDTHGVADLVDLRLAPLVPVQVDAGEWIWYNPAQLPDETIDLVFVDGPPESTGPQARYPAFPLLHSRLASGALIILDDAARRDEADMVHRWVELHPEWEASTLDHQKGTAILKQVDP
jgi:predicted O-methyltransferase YrrM